MGLHFYCITALRHLHDPQFFPPGLVELQLGTPNVLFFALTTALGFLLPVSLALKIVVAANTAGIVLGATRLARYLGRTLWIIPLIAPLTLGFSYYLGLQAYQLSFGLLLAATVDLDRFAQSPTRRRLFGVCAWVVVMYLAHEQALMMFLGMLLLFSLARSGSLREMGWRCLPLLLGVVIILVQLRWNNQRLPHTSVAIGSGTRFEPVLKRLIEFPDLLLGAHARLTTRGISAAIGAAIAVFGYYRFRGRSFQWPGVQRALWGGRYAWVAATNGLLYVFGPASLNTANFVGERFLPWMMFFGVVSLAPGVETQMHRVARALLLMIPVAHGIALAPALVEVEEDVRSVQQLLPYVKRHSAIAMMRADVGDSYSPFTLFAADPWVAAQTGGRPLHSFMYSTSSPARYPDELLWRDPMMRFVIPMSQNFLPRFDFTAFRYVLLRSQSVGSNQLFTRVLAPEGRFVASTGYWTLLESTLPVRPITTSLGTPYDCGDSLADRIWAVRDVMDETDWLTTGRIEGGFCSPGGGVVPEVSDVRKFVEKQAAKIRESSP